MKAGKSVAIGVMAALSLSATVLMKAQAPAGGGRGQGAGPAGRQSGPPRGYPQRPPADPTALERGRTLYGVNCAFCHGADARGGDGGGPNLLRSQLVLSDERGELIADVVQNGRPGTTMLPLNLTMEQIGDIADFLHSFRVGGYDITREPPPTILVGNAAAGEAAFRARCADCHSVSGDLQGFAARFDDERDMQQMWLMPSSAAGRRGGGPPSNVPPTTAAVTLPSGERFEGRLMRIDDFVVTIEQADGRPRSFGRRGDVPQVEITDPLQPHKDLLPLYTDDEIHDITAYLASLK
jgi:mono/diheme cytochrome c family protein